VNRDQIAIDLKVIGGTGGWVIPEAADVGCVGVGVGRRRGPLRFVAPGLDRRNPGLDGLLFGLRKLLDFAFKFRLFGANV
jgi:hypothetical protein